MAKHPNSMLTAFAPAMCLVLLLATMECINSSRVLLEGQTTVGAAPPTAARQYSQANLGSTNPSAGATMSAPSSQSNAISPMSNAAATNPPSAMTPSSVVAPQPADPTTIPAITPPETSPAVQQPPVSRGAAETDQLLAFFMHDVLGASKASAQVHSDSNGVNTAAGYPVGTAKSSRATGTTQGSLPLGTITVIDEELGEGEGEGEEKVSNGIGRAQGFYVESSKDGTNLTLMLTASFHGGAKGCADSLSFFGVYCTSVAESNIAIVGGTGKYVNAKGYATIRAAHPTGKQNAADDGATTLIHFSIYFS